MGCSHHILDSQAVFQNGQQLQHYDEMNLLPSVMLAGANVIVNVDTVFNVTMQFFDIPAPPATPAIGMRIDYWDPTTSSFPANSSLFFYQTGTKVCPPRFLPDVGLHQNHIF